MQTFAFSPDFYEILQESLLIAASEDRLFFVFAWELSTTKSPFSSSMASGMPTPCTPQLNPVGTMGKLCLLLTKFPAFIWSLEACCFKAKRPANGKCLLSANELGGLAKRLQAAEQLFEAGKLTPYLGLAWFRSSLKIFLTLRFRLAEHST